MGQLILTRKPGETIVIDGDIEVTVLGIVGNQVRIGTDAPDEVPINRKEVQRRIDRERNDGNAV